jgi:serine/threonine-protein kinase
LVIAYSTEVKIDPLLSPFNIGKIMNLDEFTIEQIRGLVSTYNLSWSDDMISELRQMIGGHPYLVRKALYEFALGRIKNIKQLISTAAYSNGPFGDHLRRYSWNFKEEPELAQSMKRILMNENCGNTDNCNKLRDIGLVKQVVRKFEPRFKIYKEYFRKTLNI